MRRSAEEPEMVLENLKARDRSAGARVTLVKARRDAEGRNPFRRGTVMEYAKASSEITSLKRKGEAVYLDFPKGYELKTFPRFRSATYTTRADYLFSAECSDLTWRPSLEDLESRFRRPLRHYRAARIELTEEGRKPG